MNSFLSNGGLLLRKGFVRRWVHSLTTRPDNQPPDTLALPPLTGETSSPATRWWQAVWYSFPVQLLVLHVRKNQLLLLFWLALFGIIWQDIGRLLGMPYLFLDPEYVHRVNPGSLCIMGIATGAFTMAFHITCYILDAHRFGFLGNEKSPFNKFCVNNSVIPVAFISTYIVCFVRFQLGNEYGNVREVLTEAAAFLAGFSVTTTLLIYYFTSTNKDIFKILAGNIQSSLRRKRRMSRVNVLKRIDRVRRNRIRVDYFLTARLRWRPADNELIDLSAAIKVLKQNHLNAFIIQCFLFSIILLLGNLLDRPAFQIPAGASIIVLCTIAVLFLGALTYWLRGWIMSLLVISAFIVNWLIGTGFMQSRHEAFGLNYDSTYADYSLERIRTLSTDSIYRQDVDSTLVILRKWRSQFPASQKPRMVFVCASGGGQRAALWTMRALQTTDSTLNGGLMKHTFLMTGASGGLIGASYFREIYRQAKMDSSVNRYGDRYLTNVGKDILNPVVFTWIVNDLFLRFRTFRYDGHTYVKDRGYAFEQQLNRNTGGWMDKPLAAYRQPERDALVPMLIMSPTIVNDGRKLYISPQPVSYMTVPIPENGEHGPSKAKGIEFSRFFAAQGADRLRFLTALRMSATFPYITPNVSLPSEPTMEIMDAGLSDNFGIGDAVRFLYVFREWIQENTSGVVFLSVRDTPKERPIEKNIRPSLFQKIFTPVGSLYQNWEHLQDWQNDNSLEFARSWFGGEITTIDLQYAPNVYLPEVPALLAADRQDSAAFRRQERAALSWHLTSMEKESLNRTILDERNQQAIARLKALVTPVVAVKK